MASPIVEKVLYARAVEAAIWSTPLVNFAVMRDAFFNAGGQFNDVIYLSQPANWKFRFTTPNNTNFYSLFFGNLKQDEAIVVEVPKKESATIFGTILTSWNRPLLDVGTEGEDKGEGGKYLFLSPDYEGEIPEGYYVAKSDTYNIYSLFRTTPVSNSKEDINAAIEYLKKLKIYPLSNPSKTIKYIDVYDQIMDGVIPEGLKYYERLSQMLKEETVIPQDLSAYGQYYPLGLGQKIDFNPDDKMKAMFEAAYKDAKAYLFDGWSTSGAKWWPDKRWLTLGTNDVRMSQITFCFPDRQLFDDRAYLYSAAFAASKKPAPHQYAKQFDDQNGDILTGERTYKLTVAANVPTNQFWAVTLYDNETGAFIEGQDVICIDSLNSDMVYNEDGTVDLIFGPEPPKEGEGFKSNWIPTIPGRKFFCMWRNYTPPRDVLLRQNPWTLEDIVRIK